MRIFRVKEIEMRIANVLLSVNVGWTHEPVGKRGISHFLEHAVFLGNNEYPEPDNKVGKYGVNLNGKTLEDRTLFYFTSLKDDSQNIMDILLSLVFNPSFPPEKIIEEKNSKIIPAIVKDEDYYPWELAYEWAKNLVFGWDFRYSMGTKEELENIRIEDLKDWHRRYYHAENSILLVPEYLKLEDLHISISGQKPQFQKIKHPERRVIIERNIETEEIVYAFPIKNYDIRAFILSVVLGNYPTSLFWRAFHKDAYMVESQVEWHNSRGGFFLYLGANTKGEKIKKKFISFIEKIRISQEDFEIAKKILTLEILERERSPYAMEHLLMMDPELRFGGFRGILEEMENISVEEIRDYLREILNLDELREVIVR